MAQEAARVGGGSVFSGGAARRLMNHGFQANALRPWISAKNGRTYITVIHKGFRINIRRLEASRRLGQALDTVQADVSTRKVVEKLEELFVVGSKIRVQGRRIVGLTNHPFRSTVTLTDWRDLTNGKPVNDILKMIGASTLAGFNGTWMLYVANDIWVAMLEDYKAESDKTMLQRLRDIEGIRDVKALGKLPPGHVVPGAVHLRRPSSSARSLPITRSIGEMALRAALQGALRAAVPIFRSTQMTKSRHASRVRA
jgi:hypothetical protein